MNWKVYMYGYGFSCIVGGLAIYFIWDWMWSLVKKDNRNEDLRNPTKFAIIQGIVERAVYTSSIVLGRPEGVAVWLAFKAIQRVRVGEQGDYRHIPGTAIYLTGTGLSVAFGVVGGLIIIGKWTLSPSAP